MMTRRLDGLSDEAYVDMENGRDTVCLDGWYSLADLDVIAKELRQRMLLPYEPLVQAAPVQPQVWPAPTMPGPIPLWGVERAK